MMSEDSPDFSFANVEIHGNIFRRKDCAKTDDNPLDFFGDGFTLRHGRGRGRGERFEAAPIRVDR